jgi:hypothetical protein
MSVEVDEGNCWHAVDIDKYSNWKTLHYIYYKKKFRFELTLKPNSNVSAQCSVNRVQRF